MMKSAGFLAAAVAVCAAVAEADSGGVARAVVKVSDFGFDEPQEADEAAVQNTAQPAQSGFSVSDVPDVVGVSAGHDTIPFLSANPTKENAAMNISKTTVAALAMTTLAVPFSALSSVPGLSDVECSLNTAAYKKVMEDAGPLVGNWSLPGIVAWNGAEQVAFSVVSNRPYDSGN